MHFSLCPSVSVSVSALSALCIGSNSKASQLHRNGVEIPAVDSFGDRLVPRTTRIPTSIGSHVIVGSALAFAAAPNRTRRRAKGNARTLLRSRIQRRAPIIMPNNSRDIVIDPMRVLAPNRPEDRADACECYLIAAAVGAFPRKEPRCATHSESATRSVRRVNDVIVSWQIGRMPRRLTDRRRWRARRQRFRVDSNYRGRAHSVASDASCARFEMHNL